MAKVEKVFVHYGEKRSGSFQTADHSLSVEVTLEEGDKPNDVIRKYQAALRDRVTEFTVQEINRLVDEAAQGGRRP